MKNVILYGAGHNMRFALNYLASVDIIPVCICDGCQDKWHSTVTYKNNYRGEPIELKILPFSEAIALYPDYSLYISTSFSLKCQIIEELIEYRLLDDTSRIINYEEYQKGCHWLSWLDIVLSSTTPDIKSRVCCVIDYDLLQLASNDEEVTDDRVKDSIKTYYERRSKFAKLIANGELKECKHCGNFGFMRKSNLIEKIHFAGFGVCQLKCTYCCNELFKQTEISNTIKALVKYYNELKAQDLLVPDFAFIISFGEMTINPHGNEVLDFVIENTKNAPNASMIFSNCVVYSEKIALILRNGGSLVTSIDSGTNETFKQIKGFDLFEKTLSNVKKYVADGIVWVKYIFTIDGSNANEKDIDGFIKFIAECRPALAVISYEYNMRHREVESRDVISQHILNNMGELVRKLKKIKQPYAYYGDYLSSWVKGKIEEIASNCCEESHATI
ncbi:MAG: radical SAM protein [Fibromonadales bacterium]|nr:radical SAM protein [Fibromonadales bacterium]